MATTIHRDTHGSDAAQEHYKKLLAQHIVKNQAYALIIESLPAHMMEPVRDSEGVPQVDDAGRPRLRVRDKHRPTFNHVGSGRYEFIVPGIDEATYRDLATKLVEKFGDSVALRKKSGS